MNSKIPLKYETEGSKLEVRAVVEMFKRCYFSHGIQKPHHFKDARFWRHSLVGLFSDVCN